MPGKERKRQRDSERLRNYTPKCARVQDSELPSERLVAETAQRRVIEHPDPDESNTCPVVETAENVVVAVRRVVFRDELSDVSTDEAESSLLVTRSECGEPDIIPSTSSRRVVVYDEEENSPQLADDTDDELFIGEPVATSSPRREEADSSDDYLQVLHK